MLHLIPFLTVYCCVLAAVFGACMASFLNCMAWRVVHGESVLRGRSHCDACGHVLGARDLVPIVSYLAFRSGFSKRGFWQAFCSPAPSRTWRGTSFPTAF